MNRNVSRLRKAVLVVVLGALLGQAGPSAVDAKKDKKKGTDENAAHTGPDSVVVFIGNRLFPDFAEIVSTGLHKRQPVGDTDYSFEVESFNPHFSIIDSTKTIVALSDEPKNPAFRIKVFERDAVVDSSWAFYNLSIPHFARTSALWFQVLCFNYRGVVYKKDLHGESKPSKSNDKKP